MMPYRALDCVEVGWEGDTLPIHACRPDGVSRLAAALPRPQTAFLTASGFAGKAGQVLLLPGRDAAGEPALGGAVLGLGTEEGPQIWGALPAALPAGPVWSIAGVDASEGPAAGDQAVLGWCLGAYRYDAARSAARPAPPRLAVAADHAPVLAAARATWLVRDLVNTPANLLGPRALADAAAGLLRQAGATAALVEGPALEAGYPAVAAVGRGSVRRPVVLVGRWRGSGAGPDAPLVSLCGKGVCFDTGGYDLKPSAGMLRMKKDMAGAAIALALARMIVDADLPVRLALRLGCVENAVTGDAMRPMDVIATRAGLRVEVGNTDAEGRLVLCDLLHEACAEAPDMLLDFATLTGAARVALGPDLPALFCNDDVLAGVIADAGDRVHDPVWRLPLWAGYESWLDSGTGDLANVSDRPQAGAVIAGLFLQRFVTPACRWAHLDVYGWNDRSRPGRPEGGEAQAMRAAFAAVAALYAGG